MFNCQRKHTITCFITECRESSYQTFDFIRDRAERTDSVMTCLLGLNRENIFIRSGGINKNPTNGHKVIKFHNKVLQCFNITVKLWSAVPSEKTKIVVFLLFKIYSPTLRGSSGPSLSDPWQHTPWNTWLYPHTSGLSVHIFHKTFISLTL